MIGTMFCQYETPCGWCTRLDKECTEKQCNKNKPTSSEILMGTAALPNGTKLLNPIGEYAAKFAENHGISINEAMEHPTVKAFAVAHSGLKSGLMNA